MAEEQSSLNSNDIDEPSVESGGKQIDGRSQNQPQNLQNGNEQNQNHEVKQENPFSFKHFLKHPSTTSANNNSPSASGVCHSRSTSIINGVEAGGTPSKSATTSNLNQNHNTGARPKIPQFQSVHALAGGSAANESKMKRSPRFPSFDSQSSLSELSDEKYNSNSLFHSRSNSSFNSEYPVQRSFSNYDIDSPPSGSPRPKNHNSPSGVRQQAPVNRMGNSEFSAALPDFVQDHLVMEQWYHGLNGSPSSTSPVSVDLENLPDFTINENRAPYDRVPVRNPSPLVPLDLPAPTVGRRDQQVPVDLPPDVTEGQRGAFGYGAMDHNPTGDKIQTLPDFLSDGPIHSSNRLADVTQDTPHFNSPDENSISRLQAENDRLRNELDDSRQIIINQTCRISELEHQLQQRMAATGGESGRGGMNGSNSSSQVAKLKQQVKQLQGELDLVRRENESLKEEGAVGGIRPGRSSRTQQLTRDLRLAATTAENNLRQLLTGVDNLRLMATNLENMERQHDSIDEFLSDDDENDFEGPAL